MTGRDFSTRRPPPAVRLERAALAVAGVLALAAALESWNARRELTRVEYALARVPAAASPRTQAGSGADAIVLTALAPPPVVLADLAAVLPPNVRLEGATLAYAGPLTVELQVAARDSAAYDTFLERLAASPRFASIEPGEENRAGELRSTVRVVHVGAGR